MSQLKVALEIGAKNKKTFASALEWPGWARSGSDEAAAIEALLAYAPRYHDVIARHRLGFETPDGTSVVERLKGTPVTDFGAPIIPPEADSEPVDAKELKRQLTVLSACWDALQRIVEAADGKELQKGPRGGGRDIGKMLEHVLGAHHSYRRHIFWREKQPASNDLAKVLDANKDADAKAVTFAVSGEMPERGPRDGVLWTPRYFVRRSAWHILDHAWEIEDKVID
jgi:hypothetical protein